MYKAMSDIIDGPCFVSETQAANLQNLLLLFIELPSADGSILIDVGLHGQYFRWDGVPGPDDRHAFPQHLGPDVRVLQRVGSSSRA